MSSTRNSYWIRVRTREQREIEIHGGTKRGGGRRRVTRWSKWVSHRAANDATGALAQLEAVKKLNPLSDVQVFLAGKIITTEQLYARARAAANRAMYGDDDDASCVDDEDAALGGSRKFGARNGSPDPRFGMKGRNDSMIRLARTGAKQHGHALKPGVVTRDPSDETEVYSAWCPCGRAAIVRDGGQPTGTAISESCDREGA